MTTTHEPLDLGAAADDAYDRYIDRKLRREFRDQTMPPVLCGWFAHCFEPSAGIVDHPIMGDVECCRSCADKLDLDLVAR